MFEYSLVAGLTASGADVYLLHVTTTPSVAYVTRTEDFDCGIMISASHNPFYDNGIKLINSKGEKMREDVIGEIEKYLDGEMGDIPYATKEQIGCTVDHTAGRNRYMGIFVYMTFLRGFCGDAWAFYHVQKAWRTQKLFPVIGVLIKSCTGRLGEMSDVKPVSYTHLTLPTIA